MRRRSYAAVLLAATVLAAACGGGDDDKETTPTTTGGSSTTTAAAPAGDLAPLTGLPQPDAARRGRVALVVKVDNSRFGRPQAGINQADVVIVEKVEDGVTRLFTVFQTNDADPVGPVRSARTTDASLVGPLNRPLFAYAGTNAIAQRVIDAAALVKIRHGDNGGLFRRDGGRKAPYNLMSTTAQLYSKAPAGAAGPSPLFTYRAAGQAPAGATAAGGVHLEYRGKNVTTRVDYGWDAAAGGWKRSQDASAHVDAAGAPVVPKNVVVQFVSYRDTGQRDTSGAVVDEAVLEGQGEAWILTDGKVVKGKWSKTGAGATSYTDAAGAPVGLTPGTTWVELTPTGNGQLT